MTVTSQPALALRDDQLDQIAGGLNPQPLPPRWAFSSFSFKSAIVNPVALKGIIIVGG